MSAIRITGSTAISLMRPIASYEVTCPTDTCGSRNVALLAAITMSASATKCSPPPAHTPFTAAITGFQIFSCQDVKASSASRVRRDCSRSAAGSRLSSAMSSPVWNALPSPVFTITRTCGSASSSRQASSSSNIIVWFIAFPTCGRLKTSHPMCPSRSTTSVSYDIALPPLEFRIALLAERGEPFAEILAPRRQFHCERLVLMVVDQRLFAAAVDQPLRKAERHRRAPRQLLHDLVHRTIERSRGHDPVHHAPVRRFRRVHHARQEQHLAGTHLADPPRQEPCGAAVGREAAVHERHPEPRGVGGDGEVGCEREVEPDPRAPPLDAAHHRRLGAENQWDEPVRLRREPALDAPDAWPRAVPATGVAEQDVEAGAEVLTGRGDQDHSHRLVATGRVDR